MATVIELDIEIPDLAEVEVETPSTEVTPSGGETVLLVAVPGPPGPQGPPGEGTLIIGETPAGAINGTNTVFTTADNFQAGRIEVFLNGLNERHFSETGANQITFEDPPWTGASIHVNYIVE